MNLNYAIFRSEPIMTIGDLAQIGSHNKREKKTHQSNPDINLELTKNNIELVPLNEKYVKGFYELTKDYKKEHEQRMKTEREDELFDYAYIPDYHKTYNEDKDIDDDFGLSR